MELHHIPNDGAMSHLPIVGELIIPETYPTNPPVLHLFTKTFRYNVDIFSRYVNDDRNSTICFDILRSKAQNGKWDRQFTISSLRESDGGARNPKGASGIRRGPSGIFHDGETDRKSVV